MRIFLISNMYPSKTDKLYGVFVKNMHKEFEKQGVVFSHTALIKGRTTSKWQKLCNYIKHFFHIIGCFLKTDYDLIYIHYYSHHVPLLWLLLPFKRKPWVVNTHGTDITDLINHPKIDYFAKIVLKKLDLLVVPSLAFQKLVENHYDFLMPEKIFISPSGGIDLKKFYPENPAKKHNQLVLGFVSRFDEKKGWKTYLHALHILKQRNVDFKGIIIGKGPDESSMKALVERYHIEENVDFVGFVKQDELSRYFNQMDLYIFPTYKESLGLTGLEAMACAVPVMGSRIEALQTYIKDGVNGFLFEPENADHLVESIIKYRDLPLTERNKIRNEAYQTAQAYEKTKVTKAIIEKLNTLIEKY